jgi:hypothetical protein
MRDIGLLIWVVFLIVGVVGSMSSKIRRMNAGRAPATLQPPPPPIQAPARVVVTQADARQRIMDILQAQMQATAPPGSPQPVAPRPPPPPPPPKPAAPRAQPRPNRPEPPRRPHTARLFSGPAIVRAVIAAEVLGKPRGLNDEYR